MLETVIEELYATISPALIVLTKREEKTGEYCELCHSFLVLIILRQQQIKHQCLLNGHHLTPRSYQQHLTLYFVRLKVGLEVVLLDLSIFVLDPGYCPEE